MARQKIGEYKAKKIVFDYLGLPYHGLFFDSPTDDLSKLTQLDKAKTYVVKVDQGVKRRFKQGLVKLDLSVKEIPTLLRELEQKGYTRFLIEEYQKHAPEDERYLAISRQREGLVVYVSARGGVDIEENQESVKIFAATPHNVDKIAQTVGVPTEMISQLIEVCDKYHIAFLEINPLVVEGSEVLFLDLAVEVDSAGAFFVGDAWSEEDYVEGGKKKVTEEEKSIALLSSQSQASFRLVVLNPDGALWMLLSGGGASIVLADEVYNQGFGKELANYGEYSGNPTAEETYLYTKNLLSLLLKSKAKKKVLIVAGGVANFTDVRITFQGIIQALDEVKDQLRKQRVKVFVRRGGPYQEEGLQRMQQYLTEQHLLGGVHGPEMVLTDIVQEALAV